jgi:lysophospholipase L1-like esterase
MLVALSILLAAAPLPVNVPGRVLRETRGEIIFGWPGVYFESRFRGTGVRVRFEAPQEHMRLLVDGEQKMAVSKVRAVDLTLGGLPMGEHVVRLEKQTESQSGGGRFFGFYAIEGEWPLAARPRPRRIEFIGDSYTVGYGNTSPVRECSKAEVHDRTDTQQAFGPVLARRYDADYRVVAYSGLGIVRNYAGGTPELSIPRIYAQPTPDTRAGTEPPETGWRPQIIVINLGTNDFSTPLHAGERWREAEALRADYRRTYAGFVKRIAARQTQARFILMGSDEFIADVRAVAASVNRDAPGVATVILFGGLELTGCDWHPSLADDRKLADLLAGTIDSIPGAWTGR